MMNDLIKQRDAEIERLTAVLAGERAEYERLKEAFFRLCRETRLNANKTPGADDSTKNIRIHSDYYRKMTDILSDAGLDDEYDAWYKEWLEEAVKSVRG